MEYLYHFCLFGLFVVVFDLSNNMVHAGGSCRESSLCCNGRDSSCVVQKAPLNAIIEDINDKPCYCDHACLKLGDCCDDFKAHCGVIDCITSEWGTWSECESLCGPGKMTRIRTITQIPSSGGKRCPSLIQTRGCDGNKCHHFHEKRVLKESALLLPSGLSKNRRANDTRDIRRNLRLRYEDSFKHDRKNEYCVEFEVIKATKPCHKLAPYNLLAEGERVTIRCDLEALVKEEVHEDEHSNSSILKEKSTKAKYHCRGEGLPSRMSRFSALGVPSCRGKWLRLSEKKHKKCTDSHFIFI